MRDLIEIPFTKLHGLGNDFIVTSWTMIDRDSRQNAKTMPPHGKAWKTRSLARLAKAICHRHTGVGADGFLLVSPARSPKHDARVQFFNADGSEAEMSGNGIRCAAACLREYDPRKRSLKIATLAGIKELECLKEERGRWVFRVAMGHPILEPKKIPIRARNVSSPVLGYPISTAQGKLRATITSMGNPHCSLFVPDFEQVDWKAIGRELEVHPHFPNRTNVEFVKVISRREIEVRFWERGVGQTASSGTGSCAAAVASILNGYTGRRVRVKTMAGRLEIDWPEGGSVRLTGPAQRIASGVYEYSPN
jgi:diaminopimelate epimerase